MFKPVEKKSLADAVFEQLREEIVTGRMEPGEALPAERMLSDMLGVNRGAVREALKRLEQARLVTIQQGGSTRVLDFKETAGTDLLAALLMRTDGSIDTKVARSVMEMRSAIAADIARLSARRASAEVIEQLQSLLEQMQQQRKDLPQLQLLSMEFWKILVKGSDNVAYQLAINSLEESYSKFRHVMLHVLQDEFTNFDAYRDIVRAIEARDEEEAEFEARRLISLGEAKIGEMMDVIDQTMEIVSEVNEKDVDVLQFAQK